MIKRHLSNRTSSIISLVLALALVPALIFLSVKLPHFVNVLLNVHEAIGNDAPLPTWERTGVLIDAYAMLAVAFAAVALLVVLLRSTLSEKVFSDCALRTLNGLSVCCFLEGILFAYVAIYFPAVICLTLAFVVISSKIVGCALPILAKKIGFDPAVMASPFITTCVDALALILYFGFASWILNI